LSFPTEKGKLGELYVFQKLIENGALPFIPIADVKGIDAVVCKKDGTYVEIQIKATWGEQSGYFNVSNHRKRDSLTQDSIQVGYCYEFATNYFQP
jgi:hypothetical protein